MASNKNISATYCEAHGMVCDYGHRPCQRKCNSGRLRTMRLKAAVTACAKALPEMVQCWNHRGQAVTGCKPIELRSPADTAWQGPYMVCAVCRGTLRGQWRHAVKAAK